MLFQSRPVLGATFLLSWTSFQGVVLAQSLINASSLVNAPVDAGTFADPSVLIRPKYRYWLPDASVDPAMVASDIQAIGTKGAGGIEFLNYWLYGGAAGSPVVDWSTFAYGTAPYNTILLAALEATKNSSLIMDFSMGPQSGQGVPADPTNPGLSYELVSFNATVQPGGTFNGTIPGFGAGNLVSVITAGATKIEDIEVTIISGENPSQSVVTQWTLANDSITDVSADVASDGSLSVTFPANDSIVEYIVYASYYHLSLARACIAGPNPQNIIQNGSFAVDHFSPTGAKVTTDFLEQSIFINGAKELMSEVGKYIWEDSIEVSAQVVWTPGLPDAFQTAHGYNISSFAILLAQNNGNGVNSPPVPVWFITDAPDQGEGIVADFRDTMTVLYGTYVDHFVQWSQEFLGLEFSAQIGYNMPVDMLQNINRVSAPETETLAFHDDIDSYRQYVGVANLAGLRVISCELGAVHGLAYQQGLPSILAQAKRAYAAGVNQMVIHGGTYSHQYPQTTWPGYTQFQYVFSDAHSRHEPSWDLGEREFVDSIARHNFVLQSGTPKLDVVFWDKQSATNATLPTMYPFSDLDEAGYNYQYLSPANFDLPQAVVTNGVLAADGPAYKVLVLREDTLLTGPGIAKLAQYANQGLPVIIAGNPSVFATANQEEIATGQATLANLTSLPNVHKIDNGPVAAAIASIGIQPTTIVSSSSLWLTSHRQLPNGTDFVYVFNSNGTGVVAGTVSFASTNTPFTFDTNTGTISPVPIYSVNTTSGYTTIPLSLAANQSTILAFSNTSLAPVGPVHITSAPVCLLGVTFDSTSGVTAQAPAGCTGTVTTSANTTCELPATTVPAAINLTSWTLIAESWTGPSNFTDLEPIATKTNTTHQLTALAPWIQIPGLQKSSGIGYYNTSFTWNSTTSSTSNASVGARIDFGPVIHTLQVQINGQPLPPLDTEHAEADISSFLVDGENTVTAQVATTLWNVLLPIWSDLMTSGEALSDPDSGPIDSGLVGSVVVTPWQAVCGDVLNAQGTGAGAGSGSGSGSGSGGGTGGSGPIVRSAGRGRGEGLNGWFLALVIGAVVLMQWI